MKQFNIFSSAWRNCGTVNENSKKKPTNIYASIKKEYTIHKKYKRGEGVNTEQSGKKHFYVKKHGMMEKQVFTFSDWVERNVFYLTSHRVRVLLLLLRL